MSMVTTPHQLAHNQEHSLMSRSKSDLDLHSSRQSCSDVSRGCSAPGSSSIPQSGTVGILRSETHTPSYSLSRSSGECSHDLAEAGSYSRDRRYEEQAFSAQLQRRISQTVLEALGIHRLTNEGLSIRSLESHGSTTVQLTYTVLLPAAALPFLRDRSRSGQCLCGYSVGETQSITRANGIGKTRNPKRTRVKKRFESRGITRLSNLPSSSPASPLPQTHQNTLIA